MSRAFQDTEFWNCICTRSEQDIDQCLQYSIRDPVYNITVRLLRLCLTENDLLHISQVQGYSPLCMCSCLFRSPWSMNDLLQTLQVCGRSPLCMR